MCQDTVGAARALLRPRASAGQRPVGGAEPAELPPRAPEPPPEPRLQGPLELDLGRVLLVHRVEDIPPPPDFVWRPFVSSRRQGAAALAAAEAKAIEPRPCRVVDEREACRRVERGWRVDVAPCVHVGAESLRSRVRRRGLGVVRALPPNAPNAPAVPLELEAASA